MKDDDPRTPEEKEADDRARKEFESRTPAEREADMQRFKAARKLRTDFGLEMGPEMQAANRSLQPGWRPASASFDELEKRIRAFPPERFAELCEEGKKRWPEPGDTRATSYVIDAMLVEILKSMSPYVPWADGT